jgi:hypothetical protein
MWDSLSKFGADPFSGYPLGWEGRTFKSFGHVVHGEPMFCNSSPSDSTDIADLRPREKNIGSQSLQIESPSQHFASAIRGGCYLGKNRVNSSKRFDSGESSSSNDN